MALVITNTYIDKAIYVQYQQERYKDTDTTKFERVRPGQQLIVEVPNAGALHIVAVPENNG